MHIVTLASVSVSLCVIRFAGTRSGPVRSGLLHSTICRLTSLFSLDSEQARSSANETP